MHFLRSFLCRPHTERISDGVLKMFRRNRNRDSCEKNTTGTEYTGIRRISAGLGNLAIRSGCRISLRRSSDWHLRHSRVLAADLRLFSFSRDVDTAFAAALLALALVITMIQTYKTPLLQRSVAEECCRGRSYAQKILQWWYGVNNFEVQNTDMKVYGSWTSTRQKNSSMVCKQGARWQHHVHQYTNHAKLLSIVCSTSKVTPR
jgi:hypothetical protein